MLKDSSPPIDDIVMMDGRSSSVPVWMVNKLPCSDISLAPETDGMDWAFFGLVKRLENSALVVLCFCVDTPNSGVEGFLKTDFDFFASD